ncbi:hypothetical protein ACIPVB_13400 [Microbacterium sp. NPDC090007]|uniref:hypothetical protein n=1 Tax=Microbacterium sp. NPDC090007 TaxID=3364204 RepID=UPI0037FA93F0
MSRLRPVPALLGVVFLSSLVSGCALTPQPVETRLPPAVAPTSAVTPAPTTPAPSPSSSPTVTGDAAPSAPVVGDDVVSCGEGGTQALSGSERAFTVVGTCAELTMSGSALTVNATDATIETLRLSGDRLRVRAASVAVLRIQGNDDSVTSAAAMDSVDVSGDRATVQADGAIAAVVVRGQDNVVQSGLGVGSATVEGRGNQIR